jgi:hypothetical protein
MTQLSRLAFALAVVVAALVISATTLELPARVASHFGPGNLANDAMDRLSYLMLMLGLAVGLPVLLVATFSRMPRAMERKLNIPHRDYWLAPERRQRTLAYLGSHACWLGTLLAAYLTGVHLVLLAANAVQPPRLPVQPFVTLLALFLCGMALWIFALVSRFRNRGRDST